MIQLEALLERFSYKGGMHFFIIPRDQLELLGWQAETKSMRVVCSFPEGERKHLALKTLKTGEGYLLVNAALRKKYALQVGQTLAISVEPDESPFGMEVPEVLQEFLDQDPYSQNLFLSLSDGKKRSIIHSIASAKSVETQINRTMKIFENLRLGKTHIRELLETV